ncbi:hypothetical protein [Bizionia arctica]|uniref:DUF4129 domain-containing protein n=1 Tax=Bizionia arctica TaxID=1495645 RepID=A0A917GI83_9FLAO|nr:hypothetical protein [Bizionia arctica]GGG47441.1 hypothetical protein GCM10010976_18580 [Bizionia arctica]
MKKLLLLMYFIFISILSSAQTAVDSINYENHKKEVETKISINLPETLKIENIGSDLNEKNEWKDKMPWIVALIIGLLSVLANYIIANQLRKTTKENLNIEYKATIASKNRQDWINEVRHTLTEFLTSTLYLSNIENDKIDENNKFLEKLVFAKSKLELLLSDSKTEQKDLIDSVENLLTLITNKSKEPNFETKVRISRDKTIQVARTLFNIHWEKIKSLK